MSTESPIVDEVRERRRMLLASFGGDLNRYFQHVLQVQEQHKHRLVDQLTVVAAPISKPVAPASR